jgi:hypothetical protein
LDAPDALQPIFANRVIQQFANNMGVGREITDNDFRVMRVVFRHLDGEWTKIMSGDITQLMLLERILRSWSEANAS